MDEAAAKENRIPTPDESPTKPEVNIPNITDSIDARITAYKHTNTVGAQHN